MRQITETVYTFDELSDAAKEKAREWYRGNDGGLDYDWWDSVYDDAAAIGKLMGIDMAQKPVKLMNGSTRYDPAIYFSGFWSQGDGASFNAEYSYAKGCAKAVKDYAPKDEELHRIARELQDLQRHHFYTLTARVSTSGNYSHSGTMRLDYCQDRNGDCGADTESDLLDLLRAFADWIYRQLERECDYLTSDESVDETIRCNKYEFTEDGERA